MIHTPAVVTPPVWPGVSANQRSLLAQRVYRFRVLGMGSAALPLGVVLYENGAGLASWAWLVVSCLLWPHLARLVAGHGEGSYRRELANLLLDSAIAGTWLPLLHFNLLPSVLIVTVATADKINTGVRGLWWRALPGMVLAALLGTWVDGFTFAPQTSMTVILACLPIMFGHTLSVSLASYRLIRRVQSQNRELDAASRTDALTGLYNRGQWQQWADQLLHLHHVDGRDAVLMMVDVDHFKSVNDEYGHITGDDMLRAVATILRQGGGPAMHIGRFGGDEFALVMAATCAEAMPIAERMRSAVERLRLPQAPDLACSICIGMAQAQAEHATLRAWIDAADHALYRAKHGGRNRCASADLRAVAGG